MKKVKTIAREKRHPIYHYSNFRIVETHRVYNKWYKEVWWWLQENHETLVYVVGGIVLAGILVLSYAEFMKGGK